MLLMKKINLWGFSIDDIGLDGYSTEEHLNNILNFLDEYRIKATFFRGAGSGGQKIKQATRIRINSQERDQTGA